MSNLITFPPSFLLIQLFRRSRRKETRSKKIRDAINKKQQVETLEEDLKLILNNIGIKNIIHKPYKKNTKEHMNYKNYYINNEILEMVNFYIKNDLENLNFTKINNINDL